jgi:hypothetical protein
MKTALARQLSKKCVLDVVAPDPRQRKDCNLRPSWRLTEQGTGVAPVPALFATS